jgi:hypothetical protein
MPLIFAIFHNGSLLEIFYYCKGHCVYYVIYYFWMRVDAHCRFLIRLDRRPVVISSDRVYNVELLDCPPQHIVHVAEVSTMSITILIPCSIIISYRYLPNIARCSRS